MGVKSGKNRLPDKHDKAVSITDRRDLTDEICLEVEGGPETRCESIEWHFLNKITVFAPLVINRTVRLTREAWKYFKRKLEILAPKLNGEYNTVRKGRKDYKKGTRIEKSLKETGKPPKGFRRISKDPGTEDGGNDQPKV